MPDRIVSLEPSVTATLVALGQRDRLVAVTRYCHRLTDVGDLPRLDTTWSLDAAAIAELKPDLVITSTPYRAGKIDELLKVHLNVLCLYPRRLTDIYAHIRWLGRLCDVPERAESVVEDMQTELAALQSQASGQPRRRVYVEIWPNPLMNASTWVAEIVEALGGEFVPVPAGRQVSEQEILDANPQVMVACWAGVEELDVQTIMDRPGWSQVDAIGQGCVVAVNEIMLNAPGPNLKDGMREIFRALYPDLV